MSRAVECDQCPLRLSRRAALTLHKLAVPLVVLEPQKECEVHDHCQEVSFPSHEASLGGFHLPNIEPCPEPACVHLSLSFPIFVNSLLG